MKKVSILIPVYYNRDNLRPLYEDLKQHVLSRPEYLWEIVMVDDGSQDGSWDVMKELASTDDRICLVRLSRNFGSHAAILCGMSRASGDCAVLKAADLQEPSEMILDMVHAWEQGNHVVLAVRQDREESGTQKFFANTYYDMVRRMALPGMPQGGFDVFLLDCRVINVLLSLDERNSAITGQILWSGFRTAQVPYIRKAREIGTSKWTLRKKIRLVTDTLFSFSTVPITAVTTIGAISFLGAFVWAMIVLAAKLSGAIDVSGWTTLFIFNLFSFGVIMLTLGILGGYLWRTFDASRNRPVYIVEEEVNHHLSQSGNEVQHE